MDIHSLAGRMLLALLLIQIFHACGYVVLLAQTSRCLIANASHLPDDKYAATVSQTVVVWVQIIVHSEFFCLLFFLYHCEYSMKSFHSKNESPMPDAILWVLRFLHLQRFSSPLGNLLRVNTPVVSETREIGSAMHCWDWL